MFGTRFWQVKSDAQARGIGTGGLSSTTPVRKNGGPKKEGLAQSSFAKKNALQIRTPDRTPDRPYVAVKMQGFETCSRLAYARRSLFAQTSVFTIPNEPPLTSRQI